MQLSVKESVGEILRERWTKYIVASVLIHGAMFSVPFPLTVPRFAAPIEVFILEGPGSPAPSGTIKKQEKSRGKQRLEMRRPMVKAESHIRPQEISRSIEQRPDPAQTVIENITAHEPAARNDPVDTMQIKSGVTVGSGREEKALLPSKSGAGAVSGSNGGSDEGKREITSFSGGSKISTTSDSGRGTGTGSETDMGFGSPSGPRFLHREIPEYPFLARKRKIEGKVVLAVVIDATGRLAKAEVIEASNEAFANASLEALKKSTFLPARRNGQPVTSRAILPIRFSLIE